MLILTSWLKEFVPFECSVEQLAHDLTMAGLEVEGVESAFRGIEKVVAVKINRIEPHQSASNLRICTVDTGRKEVTVVCGAPNVEQGRTAVLALPGTVLPDGTLVKEAMIHGIRSYGMLCSQAELGIGEDAGGIMYLDEKVRVGTPLPEALGLEDYVLEIGITPNRSDCLSVMGVAREVSALYDIPMTLPFSVSETAEEKNPHSVNITIEDPELCGRYAGAIIRGVKPGPSPVWITSRLAASGIRPINNIVDVTNYVLLETGQPLHAFDLQKLDGNAVVVRCARKGEKLETLDGKERELQEGMLAICDKSKPVAVAGVMGGANSEVTDNTDDILLESAWFQPSQVRRTAKKLKLSTEASYRFERGVDPGSTVSSMLRAVELIQQTAGGKLEAWRDVSPLKFEPVSITLRPERAAGLIGADITAETMARYLEKIGFAVTMAQEGIDTEVPLFRPDVTEEIDLVEEIARLHGFDTIPTTWPVASIITEELESSRAIESRIRSCLACSGLNEIISYSFTSPADIQALGFEQNDRRLSMVKVQNPLTEDQSVMRTSLVPSLLRTVARNHARRNLDLKLFETGTTFIDQGSEKQPVEEKRVACVMTGRRMPAGWAWNDDQCDLFDIKGVMEDMLEKLNIDASIKPETPDDPFYINGASITVSTEDGAVLGTAGEVSPPVLKAFDISSPVYLFDFSLHALEQASNPVREFKRLARHPAVELDLAMVLKDHVRAADIMHFIQDNVPAFLEKAEIFDVYAGKPIPAGYKSIAVRFTYRADDRTLSDHEVNAVHQPLVDEILKKFDAELRR